MGYTIEHTQSRYSRSIMAPKGTKYDSWYAPNGR